MSTKSLQQFSFEKQAFVVNDQVVNCLQSQLINVLFMSFLLTFVSIEMVYSYYSSDMFFFLNMCSFRLQIIAKISLMIEFNIIILPPHN